MQAFDLCNVNPLILWLLPFLLGSLLGYLLWGRYKSQMEQVKKNMTDVEHRYNEALFEVEKLKKIKTDHDNEVHVLRNRMREMEASKGAVPIAQYAPPIAPSSTPNVTSPKAPLQEVESSSITSKPSADVSSSITSVDTPLATTTANAQDKLSSINITQDHLQIIEGVGPKVEQILHSHGIKTFTQLAQKNPDDLRTILDSYGSIYKMIDPTKWIAQAKIAAQSDWQGLIKKQHELHANDKNPDKAHYESKIEKYLIKQGIIKRYKSDDLQAIEGIGPKIEQLLQNAGINTWLQLSTTSTAALQAILDQAGPRYMLAEPKSWPQQAQLAHTGQWDAFEQLQKELIAGREKKK
jgi:predicted flap endonuclease-1-like 5' DNA nuclease